MIFSQRSRGVSINWRVEGGEVRRIIMVDVCGCVQVFAKCQELIPSYKSHI